jgi:hypothetical protein
VEASPSAQARRREACTEDLAHGASATSRKTPQPASSSACLSGPGPSTSRSIAWRSRRTDLGRQHRGNRENRGQSHLPRHIHRRQDSGALQLPRVALGLLLKFGHPATRRWGPHSKLESRSNPPLNGVLKRSMSASPPSERSDRKLMSGIKRLDFVALLSNSTAQHRSNKNSVPRAVQ